MGKKRGKLWDVLIVGAGASGMMAAITAAKNGNCVLLIEHMDRPGKKLLATGNGKCNYTNAYMNADCFHGDFAFVSRILRSFSNEDCIAFFHELGIYPKQKRGGFYPNSQQALSVLLALEHELVRTGVSLVTNTKLLAVQKVQAGFVCETSSECYYSRQVIFATGLLAAPKLGSDGSAISVIKKLGHRFSPVLPALCGFYCEGMNFKSVSGVRCDAQLTLTVDHDIVGQESGELQMTDYGLSGIPVFQLSAVAARALDQKKTVQIHIDFLPELSEEQLLTELTARGKRALPKDTAKQMLCGLLHQKLIPVCLSAAGICEKEKCDTIKDVRRLSGALKHCTVQLVRTREAEYAQVCTGGIRTDEVNPKTLESLLCPGVYFAGELLDVDGICGGYNLQWAWSTGYIAGSSIRSFGSEKRKKQENDK